MEQNLILAAQKSGLTEYHNLLDQVPQLLNQHGRPKRFICVRHGQSQGNVDRTITQRVPDHELHLTREGRQQALNAGMRLKHIVKDETIRFIVSPYTRAKETFNGISQPFGGPQSQTVIIDPRIRELEYGNYDRTDMDELHRQKKSFGAFFYRFPEGESPADVYDRASAFLESVYRCWQQKREDNYVVVGHGVMLLILLMRFFGMSIDDYYALESLDNCEIIVLEKNQEEWYDTVISYRDNKPKHIGLRRKQATLELQECWDGADVNSGPKVEVHGSDRV
jgi:broad specificity phosphatase PhoE